MRVLITGGFGYLGGRLALHLANYTSHEIILASRQKADSPYWLSQAKVTQIQWEIPAVVEEICSDIDVIVHLAGMNAQDCANDPVGALDINGVATARLVNSAITQNVKRFIYLSTAHVYVSPLIGTITEETCPSNLHPYATSHRAGEDVVRAAHLNSGIEGVVIRLSNAYGAPAHKGANCWMLLVNDLCKQVVMTENLVLHSSGQQWRDFITMTDVVRGIQHLIDCPSSKLDDGLFNLGGARSLRIGELAEYIVERSRKTLDLEPSIQTLGEPLQDATESLDYRIDKLLDTGFELKGDLNDEIDDTLRFCFSSFSKTR